MDANLSGLSLRHENRFTTSRSKSLIVSMADGCFVKNYGTASEIGFQIRMVFRDIFA